MGCHYATRIPRYGRALAYVKPQAHAIITAEGNEVFRLDLEAGRFLKPFELGGFEGPGGEVKSAECVGVADGSHGLLAFGTNAGTTEFWDPRSRNCVGVLAPPANSGTVIDTFGEMQTPSITAMQFHHNGLTFATGNQAGIVTLYDLRSPAPVLSKDQGYGFPIQTLSFFHTQATSEEKVLSADKRIIKIWDFVDGTPWTSVEPSVDINHVCHIPNTGMIFTANEGQQMHSFLIPALGPSPWWCSHLDTQIEQLADRSINDPDAYASATADAATYDNYKFLTKPEMRQLNLDHLLASGKGSSVVRPYMHGYFVDQRLYDEARLIADPFEWERQKQRLVAAKIEKDRESRIRTSARDKAAKIKVNKRLAERLEALEHRFNRKHKDAEDADAKQTADPVEKGSVLQDPRFKGLFSNPDFEVDETSREFQLLNPSTRPTTAPNDSHSTERKRSKTAVEEEEEEDSHSGSSDNSSEGSSEGSSDDDEPIQSKPQPKKKEPEMRISSSAYRKSGHDTRGFAPISKNQKVAKRKEKSFGSRVANVQERAPREPRGGFGGSGLGDKEVTFVPQRREKPKCKDGNDEGENAGGRDTGGRGRKWKDRRSASGNTFRRDGLGK